MNEISAKGLDEQYLLRLYRHLPKHVQSEVLSGLVERVCLLLPLSAFDGYVDEELSEEKEVRIAALLKITIPWGHLVAEHLQDNLRDALDYAFGDDSDIWLQILEGEVEILAAQLYEAVEHYSDYYPGFLPDWDERTTADFIYEWRQRFYAFLLKKLGQDT